MDEDIKNGAFHRKTLRESGVPFVTLETFCIQYLKTSELDTWLEINRRANWTEFEDGEFIVRITQMMEKTGLKKRQQTKIMGILEDIGFLSVNRRKRTNRYHISYDSTRLVSKIIMLNPGIGRALRKIHEERNVVFITNKEVEEACKIAGVGFKRCDFLKK